MFVSRPDALGVGAVNANGGNCWNGVIAQGKIMDAVRIRKKLDSEMLCLPELKPLLGKTVEIIVREEAAANPEATRLTSRGGPLGGSILRDDDPFGPAVPPEEWEANR